MFALRFSNSKTPVIQSGALATQRADQRCVRRGAKDLRAAMLAAVPAGASPAGGISSVTTVAMPDHGEGDRTVESSGVNVLVGQASA